MSKVPLVEEPKSERHIVLKNHPAMDRPGLDCVADVLIRSGYGLRTAAWVSEQQYTTAFNAAIDRLLRAHAEVWLARNRPDLAQPRYRTGQSLQSYARQIETACGAPKDYIEVFTKHGETFVATNGGHASPDAVAKMKPDARECMDSVLLTDLPPKVATWLGGGGVP